MMMLSLFLLTFSLSTALAQYFDTSDEGILASNGRWPGGYGAFRTVGYSCEAPNGTLREFDRKNNSHYFLGTDAVSTDELSNCALAEITSPPSADRVCAWSGPISWTCYGSKFNRDLLAYNFNEVLDCELQLALFQVSSEGLVGLRELDDMCRRYPGESSRVTAEVVDLYNLGLNSSTYVVMKCRDENGKLQGWYTWGNATHVGSAKEVIRRGEEWLCDLEELNEPWNDYFCTGADEVNKICDLISNATAAAEVRSDDCAFNLLADDDGWSDFCSDPWKKQRKLDTRECCNSPDNRIGVGTYFSIGLTYASIAFHTLYRNVQDVRWLDKVPRQMGGLTCPSPSSWDRPFFGSHSGSEGSDVRAVRCSSQSPTYIHVSGSFRGTISLTGNGHSIGALNACTVHVSSNTITVSAASTKNCDVDIRGLVQTSTLVPSCTQVRNGCDATL